MKHPVILAFIFICAFVLTGLFLYNKTHINNHVEIKFSSWGSNNEVSVLREVISEFEQNNPNIKINLVHIPQNYFQKLQLLFASDLEPDVIFINNQNIQMYINAGRLENLSTHFDGKLNNFYKESLDCFKKDEKLYAIPRDISNLVIYYNKNIFKNKQKVMPNKIKDIFELREIAKSVTTSNNWGINYEDNPLFWLYYVSSNGGGILSNDGKNIIINNNKSLEAINLYADMINKDHSIPNKAEIGSMTSAQMFINEKLAMYLSGRWMTPKFRETITFDWDVVEFPAKNKVLLDASGWAVSKKSKHKQEAFKFIEYLSNENTETKFAQSGLIIPANKNAKMQENNQKPKNYSAFKTMIKNAKPTPVNENYSYILDMITEKTEDIFNGKKNAEDVFTDIEVKKLEKLI